LDGGVATVSAMDVDFFTQAMVQSVVEPSESVRTREVGNYSFAVAPMRVTDTVVAYMSKSRNGNQMIDMQELDLPPTVTQTVGIRLDLDRSFTEAFEGDDQSFLIALHGLEHVMIATAPLLAGCDRGDLGSGWYGVAPDTLRPALLAFDRVAGGIGLSEMLFANAPEWIRTADTMLRSCSCTEGCPACLLSPRCEIRNEGLDKAGTFKLLDLLMLGI
jgi:DEAD/DEAH box helicase domain-containing protein